MKKILFVLVSLVMSFSAYAQSNDWHIVDCDWTKLLNFEEFVCVETQSTSKLIEGKILITYKDFGPAGSLCDISIIAKGKNIKNGSILTIFDGTKKSHFEDVSVFYNSTEKTVVIKDKFGEIICAILYSEDSDIHALYIEDIIHFANQVSNKSQSNTSKRSKRTNKRK